jgi:hypothetical protein
MKAFELFEKKFLFSATRVLFLALVLLTMLAFIVGSYKFIERYQESRVSTKVSADSVFSAIEAGSKKSTQNPALNMEGNPSENVESGLKIPQSIKDVFTGGNQDVLNSWLKPIAPKDRQNFIDELSSVLAIALEKEGAQRKNHADIVTGAVNKYKELKFAKIDDRNLQEAKFESNMTLYAGIAAGFIALLALLSLVLVLLAIERNTRPAMPLNIDMKRF